MLWYANIERPICPHPRQSGSIFEKLNILTRGTQEKSHDRKYFQVGDYDLDESLYAFAEKR